jgi:hypothetical protein
VKEADMKNLRMALVAPLWLAACQPTSSTQSALTLQDALARNGASSLTGLVAVGDHVSAKLVPGPDGALQAAKLKIKNGKGHDGAEAEVGGPIGEIDAAAGTLSVLGVKITVGPMTKYKNLPADAPLGALKVGDRVSVEVAAGGQAPFTAVEIERKLASVSGPAEAVTDTSVTVLGVTFAVNGDTHVKLKHHGHHDDGDEHDDDHHNGGH